ncbi:MAG TPA: D-2-hydroxyacid dehydrogenase [Thiobacillaceae bacterium]|nr:D-2-hydroxyacid dehydrogenase [Thiobacillaceae bacterium]
MKHYVVFLDRATLLAELPVPGFEHTWVEHPMTPAAEAGGRLWRASIAITNKVPVTAAVLDTAPRLRLVAVAATGVNNVDLEACRARGVAVTNIRDYALHTVPEHVFMLLLALRRNLLAWRRTLAAGAWQRAGQFCLFDHEMHDLHGSILGVFGHGSVGRGVAELGRAFGMEVLLAEHKDAAMTRPGYTPFDEVLARADHLSLHVPLTDTTRLMIGPRELGRMKRNAVLINCARGGVVDEAALLAALQGRRIAGAATDVLEREPPADGNPLLDADLPNLIVTPHVAWAGREAMQGLGEQLIRVLESFVAGRPINLVVPPPPSTGSCNPDRPA